MGTFKEGFQDLGLNFLDSIGDVVGGFGDNIENQADRAGIVNSVAATKIQLAISEENRRAKRDIFLQNMLKFVTIAAVSMALGVVSVNLYKKVK